MTDFISDFEIIDIESEKTEPASWYQYIEQSVHDLFDNNRTNDIIYTKIKYNNNKSCTDCYLNRKNTKYEYCVISKKKSLNNEYSINVPNIMLSLDDGSKYLINKVSNNNKISDEKTDIPEEQCIICYEYLKNHVIIPCGHVITCTRCTNEFLNTISKCPICGVLLTQLIRIFK
jgi:hypothetical protein